MMRYAYILLFLYILPLSLQAQIPVIDWTSYYAGRLTTFKNIVYEPHCNCIYATGYTADSTEVATLGSYKPSIGSLTIPMPPVAIELWKTDLFLAKFDLAGNRIWSTYFGGAERELGADLAVDASGNIYIAGSTKSTTDIATSGSLYSTKPIDSNNVPFLSKFNPTGELLWSTYYDINTEDTFSIAYNYSQISTDIYNNVYLSIYTSSTDISTTGAYQEEYGGGFSDAVLVKFDSSGNRLWASYYGGEGLDGAQSKIGKDGYLYLFGRTSSTSGIATAGTFKSTITAGDSVSFLLKLHPVTGAKIWGTYMDAMYSYELDVDSFGNVYVYGNSYFDGDFTTLGAHQPVKPGGIDLIIMKFDNTGNRVWGTYFGGAGRDENVTTLAWGALPIRGNIVLSADDASFYICGITESTEGIATDCAYEPITPNGRGFLAKFDTTGNIIYGSYYDAEIHNIALNTDKNAGNEIYFVGRTTIDGLATTGSHKPSKTTILSGLIGKFIETCPTKEVSIEYTTPSLIVSPDFTSYTWYHNGTAVSSGASNTFNPGADTTGYYYAEATYCGCTYLSDTLWFDPMGIEDWDLSNYIQVYPNPTSSILHIQLNTTLSSLADVNIKIIDVFGREQTITFIKKEKNQIAIDIKQLPAGIYAIILDNQQKNHSLKFVKM